jgi:methionine synthase II (cobalamin-independent)
MTFRADNFGSLLRPDYLKQARARLALSTQCGLASIVDANEISEESQEAKLELVARVAEEAWG